MNTLTFILWIGPPLILQAILLGVLVRKQLFRGFPWFFVYTSFSVIANLSRFAVRNSPATYFNIYWATEAVYATLGILVLYEVFSAVLKNLVRIWWLRLVFSLIVTCMFALSVIRSMAFPARVSSKLMACIVAAELSVRVLQVTIFALLVALVSVLGLRWRQHAFGISAGFGLYATVALFATTKFSEFGTRFAFLWSFLSVLAYSIAAVIWLWFFGRAQQMAQPSNEKSPPLSLQDLERYEHMARRMRKR